MKKREKFIVVCLITISILGVSSLLFKGVTSKSINCTYEFSSAEFATQIGRLESGSMVSEMNATGFVAFGPYIELESGYYEIYYRYTSGITGNTKPIGFIDIAAATEYIEGSKRDLPTSSITSGSIVNTLYLEKDTPLVEFRLFSNGLTKVALKSICVSKKP